MNAEDGCGVAGKRPAPGSGVSAGVNTEARGQGSSRFEGKLWMSMNGMKTIRQDKSRFATE